MIKTVRRSIIAKARLIRVSGHKEQQSHLLRSKEVHWNGLLSKLLKLTGKRNI